MNVMSYDREFCGYCGGYSVHVNGVCIHHRDKEAVCWECGNKIDLKYGRYHLGKRDYCVSCGEVALKKYCDEVPTLKGA